MNWLCAIAAVPIAALWLITTIGNPLGLWEAVRKGRSYSRILLIGGAAGVAALLLFPTDPPRRLWKWLWVPLVLDYTWMLLVIAWPITLIRERTKRRS